MAKCVEKVANKKAIEYCWSKAQLIKNEPSIECPCNTENIEKEKQFIEELCVGTGLEKKAKIFQLDYQGDF